MSKSEKGHISVTSLLITFFGAFFQNVFNGFKISLKFCVFLYPYYIFNKTIVLLFLALFVSFDCTCAGNGSKNGKFLVF
jgi:hypothetical protein